MTDIRPLVLGYIRSHPFMTDSELAETKQQLASFAQIEGYTLGLVFTEQPDTEPAAFQALVAAVHQQEAVAVVVLSLPFTMKHQLEQSSGVRVLMSGSPP